MIITRRLRDLQHSFTPRTGEYALATMVFLWGVVLLMPPDTMSAASFAAMVRIAPEMAWGYGCLALGTLRLIVLLINGAWRRTPHLRGIGALISGFLWLQISLSVVVTGSASTGLAVYPILLAFDLWNAYRAFGDAREVDDRTRTNGGR